MLVLHDCKDFTLKFDPHAGSTAFLTFTSWAVGPQTVGFGESLFSRRNIPAFYFISKWNSWWQSADMLVAARTVREKRDEYGFKSLVSYGASMGGYGAARWAVECGADASFLISPQFTIDPKKEPFETRWKKEAEIISFEFDDMANSLKNAKNITLLHDPKSADQHHTALFRAAANVGVISLPYYGHSLGIGLNETKSLTNMILSYTNEIPDHGTLQKYALESRAMRGKSPQFLHSLASAARSRHPNIAYSLQQRALKLSPKSLVILLQAIDFSFLTSRFENTDALIVRALGLAPEHPAPWRALYRMQRHHGNFPVAAEAARHAAARRKDSGDLNRVLAQALCENNELEEALVAIDRALTIDPDYPDGYVLKGRILQMMGQNEKARQCYIHAKSIGHRSPDTDARILHLSQ